MVYVCMIIPFLPASGIVKLGFVIAERILYIPSAGFCILISMGWHQLCSYSNRLKKLATVLLFFACAIFVLRTMQRAKEWRNESSLYGSALRVCPNNAKVKRIISIIRVHSVIITLIHRFTTISAA